MSIDRLLFSAATMLMAATTTAQAEPSKTIFDSSGKYSGTFSCSTEAAGGVIYDDNSERWSGKQFNLPVQKKIITIKSADFFTCRSILFPGRYLGYSVKVEVFGEPPELCIEANAPWANCDTDLVAIERRGGQFTCSTKNRMWLVRLEEERFFAMELSGQLEPKTKEAGAYARIQTGKCSRITDNLPQ